ncbi:MAG TPA: SpoIID/LytB domain-containing protein [Eubacteriaceae bacterium]|nr:SpoIID/LytB domain-containing protein [Eubacteriaceae bacterium]
MIKILKKIIILIIASLFISMLTSGCTGEERGPVKRNLPEEGKREEVKTPPIPEQLKKDRTVVVYKVDKGVKEEIEVEEYVAGVLGGEIHNDWPEEAIKAQAILARTFVMEFLTDKVSKYQGADVSTDIKEAQAWDEKSVNDRLRKAVEDTSGMVAVYDGQYIKAWFHSHGGGKTALAKEGLNYEKEEPDYIHSVDSPESKEAPPEIAEWTAEFSKDKVLQAVRSLEKSISKLETIQIGKKGASGRAITLNISGQEVSATELRMALDSTIFKSTLITDINIKGDKVIIKGKGYGHGVGMSQWGAYAMAKEGKNAEEIIKHYFKDISIVKLWD